MAFKSSGINPTKFDVSQLKFYLFLVPFAIFMALPIIFIFNHAFKPLDELYAFPPRFFVINPTLENFQNLSQLAEQSGIPLSRYVFNSLFVTVIVVFLSLALSTLAGYALSKKQFRGKKMLLEINNTALMFVPIAVMIPRFLTVTTIGIEDTYFAHILPLVAMPVGLFLIKQFIDQIPDSLIEAAVIDGATDFKIYWKVILPLIKPAIATAAILAFQLVWNDMETSNLYTTSENMRTLAFFMNTLAAQTNVVVGQGMAAVASMIMFIPNLILFVILQSKVMNTMAHSGLK
ncbi:ABC transporter permease [Halolactibacillus alkaliphilus]|uniref:ABC transporter permease n=1 Tax=Halolactibacillus alkaliphilus TaxID=442899 RepID=A0A511X1D3_9BACI|nr:carbohydrate ABC transporter permease [Halolactibacillus alkaliphilus]GEN56745.1 ABC transporter permease [Halolactibacillus alkaliphilus]GGN70864.1 ABC transporter permease [Halolactibacillus alkaliphilus]SFO79954.1 ABC-type glycerol-3-phosphate transport system, permease component [Halolactibacillus alkaliphilus]